MSGIEPTGAAQQNEVSESCVVSNQPLVSMAHKSSKGIASRPWQCSGVAEDLRLWIGDVIPVEDHA